MFKVFNIEFWHRAEVWNQPKKWHFEIDTNCYNKCIIIELGFVGVSFLRGECK